MRRANLLLVGCVLLPLAAVDAGAQGKVGRDKAESPLARSRQLVLVTTRDWGAVEGTLERFERKDSKAAWRRVGEKVPVVVGRSGLGWGAGLNAQAGDGPVKREGDGRAPAGVFALGPAFGFAPAPEASWLKLPYTPLADDTECVDDVSSSRYNLIVATSGGLSGAVRRSTRGSLRAPPPPFLFFFFFFLVGHSAGPPVAGRGSCIFL